MHVDSDLMSCDDATMNNPGLCPGVMIMSRNSFCFCLCLNNPPSQIVNSNSWQNCPENSRVLQFDEQEQNSNLKACFRKNGGAEQHNTTHPYETKFLISAWQKLAYLLSHWSYEKISIVETALQQHLQEHVTCCC